ncbi:hypothetical protein NF27_CG01660 [Candidatus Jidaibacter acanthamoeba]|uniref:Ankyrin repeat-containing protein n=1 Tax=Candidatus Jidaibacter acanthamoebae TaxID=86105 RepID=A0A0C1N0Z8_9RICK|nr:ankyrin repeat domain-containing protein [Candidatus Jidaibacter acanthamoeba]KIE05986.1 hypothetical protein NF27_CG01660 [Candidatus Jidaibacter acanthamoeba]
MADELFQAILSKNPELLSNILSNNKDDLNAEYVFRYNYKQGGNDYFKGTPLDFALMLNNKSAIKSLVEAGVKLHPSELKDAILTADEDILDLLLKNNKNLDLNSEHIFRFNYTVDGNRIEEGTFLDLALAENKIIALKALIDAGAKPTQLTLITAILIDNADILKQLLKNVEEIALNSERTLIYDKKLDGGRSYIIEGTYLGLSLIKEKENAFKTLLNAGAKPDQHTVKDAINKNNFEILKTLTEYLILNEDIENLSYILKNTKDSDLNNKHIFQYDYKDDSSKIIEGTFLKLALAENKNDAFKVIIDSGAKPDVALLQDAIVSNNIVALDVLLDNFKDLDLNTKQAFLYNYRQDNHNVFQGTPLEFTAKVGNIEVFKVLCNATLSKDSSINVTEGYNNISMIVDKSDNQPEYKALIQEVDKKEEGNNQVQSSDSQNYKPSKEYDITFEEMFFKENEKPNHEALLSICKKYYEQEEKGSNSIDLGHSENECYLANDNPSSLDTLSA